MDTVILATCVLHNFLCSKSCNKALEDRIFERENEDNQVVQALRNLSGVGGASSKAGMKVRQLFTNYFNSKAGEVPWQHKKIRTG